MGGRLSARLCPGAGDHLGSAARRPSLEAGFVPSAQLYDVSGSKRFGTGFMELVPGWFFHLELSGHPQLML